MRNCIHAHIYTHSQFALDFVSSAKVQEEIDRVVGGSRQTSLSDKDNMPYTNAVIHEIQRFGNVVPMNVARATVEDIQIGTYSVPKVGLVMFNAPYGNINLCKRLLCLEPVS